MEAMLKNKPHLDTIQKTILVILWTFRLTLVFIVEFFIFFEVDLFLSDLHTGT